MNVLGLILVFMCLTLTGEGGSNLTITPMNSTQPSPLLTVRSSLTCEIEADFPLSDTAIESRWIIPNGATIRINADNVKYSVIQGPTGDGGYLTILVIQPTIYSDENTYTCEVRDIRDPDNRGPWLPSQATLRLLVELTVDEQEITTFDNNVTDVSLSCEMSLYLRPDENLQWFRGGQQITNTDRHTITYSDGTGMGHFGEDAVGSSRISTLVISEPRLSDSGNYTCAIINTEHSQDIELTVESTGRPNPSTVQPSSTSNPTSSMSDRMSSGVSEVSGSVSTSSSKPMATMPPLTDDPIPLPIIIGAIAGVLGVIVIILIVIIIIVSYRRRSHTITIMGNGNSFVAQNGGARKSMSPTLHEPLRGGNVESEIEMGVYDRPNHNSKRSPPPPIPAPDYEELKSAAGVKYDPYYDNPKDLKVRQAPAIPKNPPPKKSKAYNEKEQQGKTSTLDMRSVPSPAVVLSGSLHRQIEQKNPDFAYPNYEDGFDLTGEPDYDQIYSEPLDPTMLRSKIMESVLPPEEAVPYSAIYDDPANPFSDADVPEPFKVTKSNIIEIRKLGMGQFGQVILAKTRGVSLRDMSVSETDNDTSKSILVAIKKLKPDAESGLMQAFEKEVKFMSRLKHDNVVRLLAVCTGGESFIMMEYMENGDLNQFLQKQALMSDSISGLQGNQITPIILLYMGVQIASGMHYLASRRFVHRDLATRNCLVGKDFIVKISDFGMSRSLYESAYYRVQGTLVLPIRWMACETFYGKFSVKSDSWAFGVTLWEIYTLGKVDPYENLTDEEVIADAIRGPDRKILPRPTTCPLEVYEIMQRCWVNEPSMRADFGEIYSRLFMIYTRQAL